MDQALLKLPEAIDFTDHIQPVKLPANCRIDLNNGYETVIGAGMGDTRFGDTNTDNRLRHADFLTMPNDVCIRWLKQSFDIYSILCATSNEGRSTYIGDSGIQAISIVNHHKYDCEFIDLIFSWFDQKQNGTLNFVLGGPLLRSSDFSLIGVTNFGSFDDVKKQTMSLQVFAYIPHYFNWISKITGLEMPICELPQAVVF